MKITIYNGSPRGTKSNSTILISHFVQGLKDQNTHFVSINYLTKTKERETQLADFIKSDTILIVFPLYTDCMPALVLRFLEKLHSYGNFESKKIGFIVQSGFPEAIHCEAITRYLKKFVIRHNGEYLGSVVKGGVEGIKIMPAFMTKNLFRQFYKLGSYFSNHNSFSTKIKSELAKPYKSTIFNRMRFRFFQKIGLANMYWDTKLKKNNVFEKRFNAPYIES